MDIPCVWERHCACGDEVAIVLVVFYHCVGEAQRCCVLPSDALLDDRIDEWEGVAIGQVGEAVGSDGRRELCAGPLLHFRVQ